MKKLILTLAFGLFFVAFSNAQSTETKKASKATYTIKENKVSKAKAKSCSGKSLSKKDCATKAKGKKSCCPSKKGAKATSCGGKKGVSKSSCGDKKSLKKSSCSGKSKASCKGKKE